MAASDQIGIASAFRNFWHSMTSYDRHASHDSPYRTGRHVPLPQSRHAPLTSVATSALESRADLGYIPDEASSSNGFIGSPRGPLSPNSPYSPGLRSALSRQSTDADGLDKKNSGEIQMQSFADGLPPPPPVSHSWTRIDRWTEDHYTELWANLCEGATLNDINELEHELDCTLPQDVRDSLSFHDGQERGGRPTGILFGSMLLDCEEIVEEWQNWRIVAEEFLAQQGPMQPPQPPSKAFAGASSSSSSPVQATQPNSALWRQELLAKQESQPPNAVQKAYCHPAWIPLARDWGGNVIAVDLAPGPAGKWGQIIIFGRDYDCKYVIARSWGAFMAMFADDLSSDKVVIEEESGEMKLLQFKKQNVEPSYFEILRWRCDQKYGRRARRRPGPPKSLHINPNLASPVGRGPDSASSPYASPVSGGAEEQRGRSPHRFSQKGPAPSPRAHISSPLARVTEETAPAALKIQTDVSNKSNEKLVSIDTPRPSGEIPAPEKPATTTTTEAAAAAAAAAAVDTGSDKENQETKPKEKEKEKITATESTTELKTVEI